MTRSRSSTPPPKETGGKQKKGKKGPRQVEFSPTNSRQGSTGSSGARGHPKVQSKDSVEQEKQRRMEMVARAKERREVMLKRIRSEKKFMLFSSLLAFLALFLWFVTVFTGHWFYVEQTEDMIERAFNKTQETGNPDEFVFISSNTGLYRKCEYFQSFSEKSKVECSYLSLFRNNANERVIDYIRTQVCFAFISVLLMIMTIVAAFYTFKNSRYVYKRLASGLYFMTTLSVLVVLLVLADWVNYAEREKLYPSGTVITYGFSLYMGWSVFLVYLINGCIFLVLSRKRKDDDADMGQIMGR